MSIQVVTDIDVLALAVRDRESRRLVEEAITAYRGGALRSAIMSVWIAVVHDVFSKARELDPLFPATGIAPQANAGFKASGFDRRPWQSTEPVRKIVRVAFETAGVPNYGPHAFRHMLARHAAKTCKTVAEFVAVSQNLGHTEVLTTLRSYGQISRERQRALITGATEDDVLE